MPIRVSPGVEDPREIFMGSAFGLLAFIGRITVRRQRAEVVQDLTDADVRVRQEPPSEALNKTIDTLLEYVHRDIGS